MVTDFEGFTINQSDDIVDAIGEIKGPTSTYRKVLLKESVPSIEKALPTVPAASKAKNRAISAHAHLDKEIKMYKNNTNLAQDNRRVPIFIDPHQTTDWIFGYQIKIDKLSIFFGDVGTEKTFSMLCLNLCLDMGKPWLDYETKRRKVLIVDEEKNRSARLLEEAIRGELGDEAIPIKYVSLAGFNLDEQKGADELLSLIATTGAGLVIIYARAEMINWDENSLKDNHTVLTTLRRIAEETGAEIILTNHGKKNGVYRGSSALMGTLDLGIKIESKDDSNWAEVKDNGKPLSKSQSYVIGYLTKNGASHMPDIMGAADSCSENTVKQAVYALVTMGKVYRTNPDKKGPGVKAIYDLAQPIPVDEGILEIYIRR